MPKSSKEFLKTPSYTTSSDIVLSDFYFQPDTFSAIETIMSSFCEEDFLHLTVRKRFKKINQTLCELIQQAPQPAFLLNAVLDYIDRINEAHLLKEPLNLAGFEFWLNNFSEMSEENNYLIRAKISGKYLPRNAYQVFFPIGMERTFAGSHFVAAHLSPDIDTMIGSFWGWIDAFAARVGTGLHLWSLPGGPPDSPITAIFRQFFGKGIFSYIARTAPTLTLNAMDLVTQYKLTKERGHVLIGEIDHGLNEKAVILINDHGHFLGEWRTSDVELIRQITIPFKSCLRWFENNLHNRLISLFAKHDLSTEDLPAFFSAVFDVKIKDCEPALEFNEKQKKDLDLFLNKVLKLEHGLAGSFRALNEALNQIELPQMLAFQADVEHLAQKDIFNDNGKLIEDRPRIFYHLERMIKNLDEAIHYVRNYVERLDVVIETKHQVLHLPRLYITLRSDVDEMRYKMQNYDFLTVVIEEQDNSLFPVGVVRAADLRRHSLGTVTLRDFCNQDEIKMASYLEVISVVDHHKSSLRTFSAPTAIIGDAQSCNVLIAEQAFLLNDRFSLGGMTKENIEKQISELSSHPVSSKHARILQRLLQRQIVAHIPGNFYVHPKREFDEYLFFLHAILDDTDLLTKVSARDVDCVAQLLNRLKSLSLGQETEVVHFDDIPRDARFTQQAAQRLLQQPDLYSLYKQIYDFRELDVEAHFELCLQHQSSNIFLDTKEQNGCARIGQTKMFASNFSYFLKHAENIRAIWLDEAHSAYQERPEIDLHMHMISTIANADEVYHNNVGNYHHFDELWFWTAPSQQGHDHLASFLLGFQNAVRKIYDHQMHVEFTGPQAEEYRRIFSQNFFAIPQTVTHTNKDISIAILRFRAGILNSRKLMITPYIPRLLS